MGLRILCFVFVCLVGVCGETAFPTESALESETSPSLQKDASLPNSSNDFLRPLSPSRKLLSLKGKIKLTDDQTTRKFSFTEENGSQTRISTTKKMANFAFQKMSAESVVPQTTIECTTKETTTEGMTTETATESTTEETTTESTTEGTTTETTSESTTEETTTEATSESTTESTTEETTTETTTESTTEETTTEAIKSTAADKIVTKSSTKLPNATKSWEKYLKKSTPTKTGSTHLQNEASSLKPSMSSDFVVQAKGQSDLTALKNAQATSVTKQSFEITKGKQSTSKVNPKKSTFSTDSSTKKQKHSKEYSKTSVTEPKFHVSSTNQPTTTPSRNNASVSVNISIDIDIDIKRLSSLNTTSEDSEENSTPTETPQHRERRYEKKRVVAGVLLVVLVSVSAACAILLVLMPSSYDVRCRRHHQIPDQVALIPSRNKCRPRFYDSSLYMGH